MPTDREFALVLLHIPSHGGHPSPSANTSYCPFQANPKKEQLIKNYELLNDEGKEDLLDYSDMLASSPRKLKENSKTILMNA